MFRPVWVWNYTCCIEKHINQFLCTTAVRTVGWDFPVYRSNCFSSTLQTAELGFLSFNVTKLQRHSFGWGLAAFIVTYCHDQPLLNKRLWIWICIWYSVSIRRWRWWTGNVFILESPSIPMALTLFLCTPLSPTTYCQRHKCDTFLTPVRMHSAHVGHNER